MVCVHTANKRTYRYMDCIGPLCAKLGAGNVYAPASILRMTKNTYKQYLKNCHTSLAASLHISLEIPQDSVGTWPASWCALLLECALAGLDPLLIINACMQEWMDGWLFKQGSWQMPIH